MKTIILDDSLFDRLSNTVGGPLAIFCMCAVADLPCDTTVEADGWDDYQSIIESRKQIRIGFASGETDVHNAIRAGMEQHELWELTWGEGYSDSEYRRLDDLYTTMTAQLDAAGGLIDKQQEDTARYCSHMALQREELIRTKDKENIQMAKMLDEMIRKNLEDCKMRIADQLPTQKQRMDGFVDALWKKFGLDAATMTQEDVLQVIYSWQRRKKYPMTTDAADHMLFSIITTTAKNNDMPLHNDLDDDLRFEQYGSEFEQDPNQQEKETYQYLGLARNVFKDGGGDDNEGGDA